jgi:predicted Rossmann fold flavoprotein
LPREQKSFDVLVLGAGAAGLMCAMEAGKRGRRVAVLEHADRIGKKILISGGGRCNFTNLHCRPENFISANRHFAKSALARYTPADFIALVEKHRIRYHEKTLGQLFCDGSAAEIVRMLEDECRAAGVEIFTNTPVNEVVREDEFEVAGFRAPTLVVASGGLSIPKMGATAIGYKIARQFSLKVLACRPALVPLTFNGEDLKRYGDLAGLSAEAIVSGGGHSFQEKILITHRGLSGPAILQSSSYWRNGQSIAIDLAPGRKIEASQRTAAGLRAAMRELLPKRLADRWLDLNGPRDWTNAGLADFEQRLHAWRVAPSGTEGYEKAEVTAGGVDTDELSAKTMESRRSPGLYFIGEVVDVTGHLGGFNFQWAWASGFCAGLAV